MATQQNLMGTGLAAVTAQAVVGQFTGALTGAGSSSQANALALPSDLSVFTTTASNTGARLPATGVNLGDRWTVVNYGASTLSVWPATTTGKIQNGSAGAAFSVATVKVAEFIYLGSDNWGAVLSA